MTQNEKTEKMQVLQEKLLALRSKMSESDEHTLKCYKLGLSFAEEYPGEFEAYKVAREEYNKVEAELAKLEAVEVELEPMPEPEMPQ